MFEHMLNNKKTEEKKKYALLKYPDNFSFKTRRNNKIENEQFLLSFLLIILKSL